MKNTSKNLEILNRNLDRITTVGQWFLNEMERKDIGVPIELTFMLLLERIVTNLQAVRLLTPSIIRGKYLENAIGLILRSNLTDFLTLTYLLLPPTSKHPRELKEKCFILLHQHITRTKKDLAIFRKAGIISSDEELETLIKKIQHDCETYFHKMDEEDKKEVIPSTKTIASLLLEEEKFKPYAMSYDLFMYYSKYEHFGIFTYLGQRDTSDKDLKRINTCLEYMVYSISHISDLFKNGLFQIKTDKLRNEFEFMY